MAGLVCRPDRSYIITGGVGGFGLALAEYLAVKGAKHLVLTSKRGLRHGGQAAPLRKLFAKGVQVAPRPCCGHDGFRVWGLRV